jgi:hypothetical protein
MKSSTHLVAHKFSDLEELSQVEILLSGNNVDHFVEVVLVSVWSVV